MWGFPDCLLRNAGVHFCRDDPPNFRRQCQHMTRQDARREIGCSASGGVRIENQCRPELTAGSSSLPKSLPATAHFRRARSVSSQAHGRSAIWEPVERYGRFCVYGRSKSAPATAELGTCVGRRLGRGRYQLCKELVCSGTRTAAQSFETQTYRKQVIREATKIDHAAELHNGLSIPNYLSQGTRPAVMAEKEFALC